MRQLAAPFARLVDVLASQFRERYGDGLERVARVDEMLRRSNGAEWLQEVAEYWMTMSAAASAAAAARPAVRLSSDETWATREPPRWPP